MHAAKVEVHVGIILELDTLFGQLSKTCMLMAIEDFYRANTSRDYSTRIVPHFRDSRSDTVAAASAAIDLLKNQGVQAILGPQVSTLADFIVDLGGKVKVPIVSQATSPSLSPKESPFFVRAGYSSSSQARAIADIVKAFGWKEVVFIYVDNDYGSGIVPSLSDAMREIDTLVTQRSVISPSASDDSILKELYRLKTMQTRVFVVHVLPSLAGRFFMKAKEAGMMDKGFAWIITETLTSFLDCLSSTEIESMQGVIGLKPYVPGSQELENFNLRWRKRFQEENPNIDRFELNVYGLWAYDSVRALAMEVERVGATVPKLKKFPATRYSSDLDAIGTSEMGPRLNKLIRNLRFKGLSGDFHIVEGQLQPSTFQVVNINEKRATEIGFWTCKYGITNKTKGSDHVEPADRANPDNLVPIIWPGNSDRIPTGWEIPLGGKKLRIGLPMYGVPQLIAVKRDSKRTAAVSATGFCIDVFEEVMNSLPNAVPFDYFVFEIPEGESVGYYNALVHQVFLKKYDAVVGDITILANRSEYVDFTLPFMESGVFVIVPLKNDKRKNAWIFTKPLTMGLWLTTGAFFVFTGFVVWILEHRANDEFRGPIGEQVGKIFWFSFSTLVFAHKEKIISNLSRFVLTIWMFVVLVLTSSFTANLTSMLTVQQLQPIVSDISDLMRNGEYIGYQTGSFLSQLLEFKKFDSSKFRYYSSFEEYDQALSRGSKNGGVSAIVAELPFARLFLGRHCGKYTMIGPIHELAGFGFAFPRGSPLVSEVSRAVLNVTEGEKYASISKRWLGGEEETDCSRRNATLINSDSLTLESFQGLFLIAGVSYSSALIIYLFIFFRENKQVLASDGSILQKLNTMAKIFNVEKKSSSVQASVELADPEFPQSPAITDLHQPEGIFTCDDNEGLSTTEPATPTHDDTITISYTN